MKPGRRPFRLVCFGEVLWDLLPQGRFLGGAPLNVAYHLRQLGAEPVMVSAVGRDRLGDETLTRMEAAGLPTSCIARHAHRPTGTVKVSLDPAGQPAFEIVEGVAWDEIPVDEAVLEQARGCDGLVFGSLAARSPPNRQALDRLLAVSGPRRVLDVNLRPPFDARERVLGLCQQAHWIKLNEDELARLTGLPAGGMVSHEPRPLTPALSPAGGGEGGRRTGEGDSGRFSDPMPGPQTVKAPRANAALGAALETLARLTGAELVCVTLGARGAALWRAGRLWTAPAPAVRVADTVGAGDAFTAALVLGLLADGSDAAVQSTLERACALGALVASLPGAQPAYDPTPYRPPAPR